MNENENKIIKQIGDETEEKEEENSKTYLYYIQRTKGGHRFDKIFQEQRRGGCTLGSSSFSFYWGTWALLFTALLLLSFRRRLIREKKAS